jgi:hypothetical protein
MVRTLFFLVIAGTLFLASCTVTPVPMEPQSPIAENPIVEEPVKPPDPFEGFPDEYHDMQLPQRIIDILNEGGRVVPLPPDPFPLQAELESAASGFGYDLTNYDLNRVISFTSDPGYNYISVPANPGIAKDGCAGLIFDKNGAYLGGSDIYEVWFYEDRAILRNPAGTELPLLMSEGNFIPSEVQFSGEIPLAVFVHNGCWLCGCIFGRCGCVICK